MSWLKTKDGFVSCDKIESIKRSTYMYNDKYRLILVTYSGDTIVYDEYDTLEECEKAIDQLVLKLADYAEF